MKDKILFWINLDLVEFCIAKFLQEKFDFNSFAVIDIQDITKDFFLKQKLVNFSNQWFYRDYLLNIDKKPDINYLKNFEKKYSINLWEIAYSQVIFFNQIRYYKFSDVEILSILENECKFFEKILDESKPDFLLINIYAGHHSHLLCKMCKARGIKILMYTLTRAGFRSAITSNFDLLDIYDKDVKQCFSGKNRTEQDLKNYWKKFSVIERNKEDIERFEKRISKIKQFSTILKFLLFICNSDYRKYYNNFGKTRLRMIVKETGFILRKKAGKSYLDKNALTKIDSETPFVYFPLHVEPERVLSFGAQFIPNQIELISILAKSLPIGYKLYVKEHPMMNTSHYGRKVSFYKKINDFPNVYLIHPSVEPEELLKKCSLVATIIGTAGLDATFFGKPSIVFVETGYSFLPSVHTVKNFEELPKIIRAALNEKVDVTILNQYIDYLEANTFEFESKELESAIFSEFYRGGYLGNLGITESKMKSFLEKHRKDLEKLAIEHIEKIQNYKANLALNQ